MKTTGVIRRIDDLGRVIIPKEIRRMLLIREGDPLEIFTDREGVYLKKYDVGKEVSEHLSELRTNVFDSGLRCTQEIVAKIDEMEDILNKEKEK